MATTNNPEIAIFPLARNYTPEARAERVNELREQIRSGAYRLDAAAVAEAILESGAIEPPHTLALDTNPKSLRHAMARFVIAPSGDSADDRRSAAV